MDLLIPVLAAEHAKFNPLEPDPSAFVLTLIMVVTLIFLMMKFAWNPILAALDAREKRITDSVSGAENARKEAEKLLKEHQQKLTDAERQVAARIEEGRAAAQRQAQEILEQAQAAAEQERDRAKKDIELARQRALSDIRSESVRLSTRIAEKVLGRELKESDHLRLADEVLAAME